MVKVGGGKEIYEFKIRRPTVYQLTKMYEEGGVSDDKLIACVVDWKIPGNQLEPGGGAQVPPFDFEAFREWVEDKPDLYMAIVKAVVKIVSDHAEKREKAEKN